MSRPQASGVRPVHSGMKNVRALAYELDAAELAITEQPFAVWASEQLAPRVAAATIPPPHRLPQEHEGIPCIPPPK